LSPRSLAIDANADDSQKMLSNFKLVLCRHCVLNSFELSGEKLDDLATL
jgi:hypothetical protein